MIELNAGYRIPAATPAAHDSQLAGRLSASLWTALAVAATGVFTGVCYLLFSGWRLLRWLRILPNDGQPVSDFFDTQD